MNNITIDKINCFQKFRSELYREVCDKIELDSSNLLSIISEELNRNIRNNIWINIIIDFDGKYKTKDSI